MTIGFFTILANCIMWWGLFTQNVKGGYKVLFLALALLNSWVLLERVGVLGSHYEHQTVSRTVNQMADSAPKFHAPKMD